MKRHNLKIKDETGECIMFIDGKHLVYRSQYSSNVSSLSYEDQATGIYFGFFNTLKSMANLFNPVNTIILWDSFHDSVRKQEYAGYKERTSNLTDEQAEAKNKVHEEYPLIVEMCEQLGFASELLEGYEADDLFALYVNKYPYLNKVLITRDEDLYQCLDENTIIYSPDDKKKKDRKWFIRKYGIVPEQWGLYKALAGCSSDTVPGIKGIGPKGALAYLKNEASSKISKKISDNIDQYELCKRLTVLPHPDLKEYNIRYKITNLNILRWFEICQQMGFKSFIERMHEFERAFQNRFYKEIENG